MHAMLPNVFPLSQSRLNVRYVLFGKFHVVLTVIFCTGHFVRMPLNFAVYALSATF